jgi:6-phosphofructokinase
MSSRKQTLAELALRQQVSAANRYAFMGWWQRSVPPSAYWLVLGGAFGLVACAILWKFLA